ncbi:CpsD/CapB family tyrosine-protein kinase [Anaeromicropila herbilytica]|uniref:non-specific protein-tyrosine kinase n=1 Tax=Anaeromicropila herbilytica TaxID=2785025 RepID=A0A7R7ENQ8_9FIRM|nr:CpsD/CapB family tyrosine-protein kinase [Anaeromicropila herbilytica]BCN32261.1 tyrosine protein kinase [Anaeromicropila herbilytica]
MLKATFEKVEDMDYSTREALNSLRTNLRFCGGDNKVICLTSCRACEGKSTTSINLARVLAADGKRVILIDADLRKSVLVGRYHIKTEEEISGLSHYLSGQVEKEEIIYESNVKNMDVIFSGPLTPNPTELLGNEYLQRLITELKEEYDMVIIDTPPLGTVIDTAVIVPNCDGVILVIESETISYKAVQNVKKQLMNTGVKILGAILNKVDYNNKPKYNYYYNQYSVK